MLIRQAVANVLHNAIKYTPPQGVIAIRTESEPDAVVLRIDDTGPGIPEDQLEKVFERFYRVQEHRSRETGGIGLGLSITRWVAEAHNGSIRVHNRPEGGCRFVLSLPRNNGTPEHAEYAYSAEHR